MTRKFLVTYEVQWMNQYYPDYAFVDAEDHYDAVDQFFIKFNSFEGTGRTSWKNPVLNDYKIIKVMIADLDHVYKAPL